MLRTQYFRTMRFMISSTMITIMLASILALIFCDEVPLFVVAAAATSTSAATVVSNNNNNNIERHSRYTLRRGMRMRMRMRDNGEGEGEGEDDRRLHQVSNKNKSKNSNKIKTKKSVHKSTKKDEHKTTTTSSTRNWKSHRRTTGAGCTTRPTNNNSRGKDGGGSRGKSGNGGKDGSNRGGGGGNGVGKNGTRGKDGTGKHGTDRRQQRRRIEYGNYFCEIHGGEKCCRDWGNNYDDPVCCLEDDDVDSTPVVVSVPEAPVFFPQGGGGNDAYSPTVFLPDEKPHSNDWSL
mmetsp:Transcript_18998/g.21245  ORF Transcript_18998/g.21245 Transcript_18998/m.21245 type:complete len:291 (-) Transcript_18998:356-1228(-)